MQGVCSCTLEGYEACGDACVNVQADDENCADKARWTVQCDEDLATTLSAFER